MLTARISSVEVKNEIYPRFGSGASMKVSALSSAFLGALLPALERARHFALAGKMYRVDVKDADALGQVCLVEKMSLVLFVFLWVDRDLPRSTCNRLSLTGRTAHLDP